MSIRKAKAQWNGNLKEGNGTMNFSNYNGPYTFKSRFEEGEGTNPEELVGAALAGCYSMFLSSLMGTENFTPRSIQTTATVHLERDDVGPLITTIELDCQVKCEGISQEKLDELAAASKEKCPISRLFAGTNIKPNVQLI